MEDPKDPLRDLTNQIVPPEIAERIETDRRLQQAKIEELLGMAQNLKPYGLGAAQFGNAGVGAIYPHDPFNSPYQKGISSGTSTSSLLNKTEVRLQKLENRMDDLERFHAWMMAVYPEKYIEFKQVQDAIKASREGE